MSFVLSPLYPILESSFLPVERSAREPFLGRVVSALADAGVTVMQYRNKVDDDGQVWRDAKLLRDQAPLSLRILLNDRVHLVAPSGCDGVHVGQTDMHPDQVREILGPGRIIGLSTHTEPQLRAGSATAADYLAIGPVYATASKDNTDPVVGLEGVRRARAITAKPLVAIGGITLERAAEVRAAGADSIAVISSLFAGQGSDAATLRKLAGDFMNNLR
jgi:thiamine-phosphate pyrophosphorylase